MPLSGETLDFLLENKIHDSRIWYQENKPRYQKLVLEPMRELVEKLAPSMLEIDSQLVVEPKVDRTISRIYRDTRFSKDKSLYRDIMWVVFCRDRKAYPCPPGFVLEFSPDGFRYGCGFYQAAPAVMEQVRRMILKKDKAFLAAKKAFEGQNLFPMSGKRYKRSKYPEQPEMLRQWLERRNLDFFCESEDFELLFSEELPKTLLEGFQTLAPIYHFLIRAMDFALEKTH